MKVSRNVKAFLFAGTFLFVGMLAIGYFLGEQEKASEKGSPEQVDAFEKKEVILVNCHYFIYDSEKKTRDTHAMLAVPESECKEFKTRNGRQFWKVAKVEQRVKVQPVKWEELTKEIDKKYPALKK